VKQGDPVVPAYDGALLSEIMSPSFSVRCRTREWHLHETATVVKCAVRKVSGREIVKVQIMLDRELWWAGLALVKSCGR
jgi:hypothetical protein